MHFITWGSFGSLQREIVHTHLLQHLHHVVDGCAWLQILMHVHSPRCEPEAMVSMHFITWGSFGSLQREIVNTHLLQHLHHVVDGCAWLQILMHVHSPRCEPEAMVHNTIGEKDGQRVLRQRVAGQELQDGLCSGFVCILQPCQHHSTGSLQLGGIKAQELQEHSASMYSAILRHIM